VPGITHFQAAPMATSDLRCGVSCPFCQLDPSCLVWRGPLVVAFRDRFPVSAGHTLVIPRRHVASWFEATPEEQTEIWRAITEVKLELDRELEPDGYNVGFNAGEAAGQTVMHLHVHVVPRFHGDVDEPAGGVRFVIPAYGNYRSPGKLPQPKRATPPWVGHAESASRLTTGGSQDPFARQIRAALLDARRADIVAAFVQGSGVEHLDSSITAALERGTHFRIITGDYLHITQSQALRRLLDWSQFAQSTDDAKHGSFAVRIVETASIQGRSFHPKSWRMETDSGGVAWVGSSNWSKMALARGIEWNLRVDRATDARAYTEVAQAFDALWSSATPLSAGWLEDYAARAREQEHPRVLGESEDIGPAKAFEPIGVQPAALEALAESRAQGRSRALVVLATGLGKTFLAAFDVRAMAEELGRTPRVLFIAHRRELLVQAAKTFRKVFPDASIGFFVGKASDFDADFVFASVQKLKAPELASLDLDRFDYVIVDESHHAPAKSYRAVLRELNARFLLGLTATPERADQADVARLFDDHVAFRADLGEGIEVGRLVPFDYSGLPDTIEFEPIPWRRYSVDQLASLAETEARMERLLATWKQVPGSRTLIFCVSIGHADYVTEWLSARGVRIVACHTGPRSADRDTALEQLASGELDAVAAVDLFNEGIDVPLIDRIVMLRPTGSPVLFLQQLGRGLRVAPGKERLQVIDFIGNHKVFLEKVRTLLSLAPRRTALGSFLANGDGQLELRSGCRVNVDLEVIEMLRKFLPSGAKNETIRLYRELRDAREERPTPGELVRMGMNPRSLGGDGWFAFVHDEGDLTAAESDAFEHAQEWFRLVEVTTMTKSFKMVTLQVLLDEDALFEGMSLERLAAKCHNALARDPSLRDDIRGVTAFEQGRESKAWRAYWRKNPINAWTGGKSFDLRHGRFLLRGFELSGAAREAFMDLTRELCDMRLATYRRRHAADDAGASSFICKVISNKRAPILKLPDLGRERLPKGETSVRMDDGHVWQFRFAKVACNVARPVGTHTNSLPDLLYRWFGPAAGKPGTDFRVRFRRSPDGWWCEPLGEVIELAPRGEVVTFPTLRAAAGALGDAQAKMDAATVRLPMGGEGQFAVRASGDSMDGGKKPIRDGDWVVLEWARGQGLDAVRGNVCLLGRGDVDAGQTHHLKRVRERNGEIHLTSDNPAEPELPLTTDTMVIARLVGTVRPEQLAPPPGTPVDDVMKAFGLTAHPEPGISRVDGHLFLLVDEKGALTAPNRIAWRVKETRPSETAYVLTSAGEGFRYAGVAHWSGRDWVFPAVDYATWRRLGKGRGASHELAPMWRRRAASVVSFLEAQHAPGDWLEARGRRCRFQGPSARGGVRIDHDSMKERTVSATDLGWVLQAHDRKADNGGLLDEAWVNSLRYLDGTPRSSTRWIDTGWALVLLDDSLERGFAANIDDSK